MPNSSRPRYRVLRARLAPTGEVSTDKATGLELRWHKFLGWLEMGVAVDMEDAKRKFGGSPVLEEIEGIH